ncbi:MAG: peptidase S9, partial [Gemmatimonadales bacterium]
ADGFSDIYRLELGSGEVLRVTELATGVSGITAMSPAMSVASETGTVVFSVFDEFEYHVYSVDSRDMPEEAVRVAELDRSARMLPPKDPEVPSRIARFLDDPESTLPAQGTYPRDAARDYDRSLSLDYITQPTAAVGQDRFGTLAAGSVAAFFSDMLGNRNLGVAVQAQGTLRDLGGQVVYQNLERRWNWGAGGGRVPLRFFQQGIGRTPQGNLVVQEDLIRLNQTQGFGLLSYAINQTRRVEFSAGLTRYSFDLERITLEYNQAGQLVRFSETSPDDQLPAPTTLAEASVAWVGDNSYFGFTSPVRGERFRVELGRTAGTADFGTILLDYRRYMNPASNLTFAVRGLHVGRYGSELDRKVTDPNRSGLIQPQFLGWQTFMRGYSEHSFERRECIAPRDGEGIGSCPAYERLLGNRIAVLNTEVRVPLVGTDRYGIVDFGFLPTEISFFADAGLAWDSARPANLELTRSSADRIPVVSTGVSARFNVLGFMILEVYYAEPWQRPVKGGHWGFQIAPGW